MESFFTLSTVEDANLKGVYYVIDRNKKRLARLVEYQNEWQVYWYLDNYYNSFPTKQDAIFAVKKRYSEIF